MRRLVDHSVKSRKLPAVLTFIDFKNKEGFRQCISWENAQDSYWAALSLSFHRISIRFMSIIAWCPQVKQDSRSITAFQSKS